jgi:hypothetical protein
MLIRIGEIISDFDEVWPALSYPLKFQSSGVYKVYLRVRSNSKSSFSYSFSINGKELSTNEKSISSEWSWIESDLVVADILPFTFSIIFQTGDVCVDSVYIGKGTPSDSFSYTSSYMTVHVKMFDVDNGVISNAYNVYDFKTTIKEIKSDNWYNFSLEPMLGNTARPLSSSYGIALSTSGSSSSFYIIWDYSNSEAQGYVIRSSDNYELPCALIYSSATGGWVVDCDNDYAIRLYSSRNSYDAVSSSITVPASDLVERSLNKFDIESIKPIFTQTLRSIS